MRILRIAAAASIAAYFIWFTCDGLRSYFGPDDMMNLYKAWSRPAAEVWTSNATYWSATVERPLGAVFYRTLFALSGFNPLPFRIAAFSLLSLNLWLSYAVVRRISRSREAAALAALVFAYHPYLFDIYQNTGMIYDVLCFTFTAGALLWYIRIRQAGRGPKVIESAGLGVLYACALNSKEMAVTLPFMLGFYELLFHTKRADTRSAVLRRFSVAAALALLTVPYIIGKQSMAANPAYAPVFTPSVFFRMWADYAQQLFHDAEIFNARKLALLWSLLIVIAWRMRSRALWFGFAWLFVTMLPLVFIPAHRSGFVLYIPWLGWSSYAGVLLSQIRGFLPSRFRLRGVRTAAAQSAAFVLLLVLLVTINRKPAPDSRLGYDERALVRAVVDQIRDHKLKPNTRILVTDDFLEPDDYMLYFIVRLCNRDDTIAVDRVKQLRKSPDPASYDWVIRFEGNRLIELEPRRS